MVTQNTNELLTKELQEQLIKIAPTAYSISGYAPTESSWKLTLDQICQIIKRQTKAYIPDVSDVTIDINHKSGSIYAYVWLPKNSKFICNKELEGNDSAISKTMTKFSPEIKEYMDKFCLKENKRIFQEEKNLPLAGILVQIERFMKIEFDENGFEYGKLFGEKYKKRATISLTCNFTKGDDNRFGKFSYLQVDKSLKGIGDVSAPKPRRSYNAR